MDDGQAMGKLVNNDDWEQDYEEVEKEPHNRRTIYLEIAFVSKNNIKFTCKSQSTKCYESKARPEKRSLE